VKVVANLVADWVTIMRRDLEANGVNTSSLKTDQDVSLGFWNMVHRAIRARPRKVHIAKEFICPPEHAVVVEALKAKFERGEDVNRYRSSAVLNPKMKAFNDRLFNDWGIQHLHLGQDNPGKPLAGRTDDCLYSYVTETDVYFLHVLGHGNYEKKELMLRMHRNWPEAIAEHQAPGVVSVDPEDEVEDDGVKTLRGAGFTYLLVLDGTAYITPGGGYMKSGNSLMALRRSDAAFTTLHGWQERLESEAEDIVSEMREQGFTPGDPPTFRLHLRGDWFCSAREPTAKIQIEMGYLLGRPPT
jgi:hypothetical protein